MALYKSLVRPHLEYCTLIYFSKIDANAISHAVQTYIPLIELLTAGTHFLHTLSILVLLLRLRNHVGQHFNYYPFKSYHGRWSESDFANADFDIVTL